MSGISINLTKHTVCLLGFAKCVECIILKCLQS